MASCPSFRLPLPFNPFQFIWPECGGIWPTDGWPRPVGEEQESRSGPWNGRRCNLPLHGMRERPAPKHLRHGNHTQEKTERP